MQKNADYTIDNIGNMYFIHKEHPTDFPKASEMLSTNVTGAFLWEHLGEAVSPDALSEILAAEYDIDMEMAKLDTTTFLTNLKNVGAVADIKL